MNETRQPHYFIHPHLMANMAESTTGRVSARGLWAWKTYLILLLTPILACPLPAILGTPESKCGYVVIIMAIYWVTESLPISVTALIPVFAFPLFGILSSSDVAKQYINDVMMLFIGGLILAIAVEYWNLHKRIALRILLFVGVEPRWLMMGMMLATWFLSMWISNTATTAMMMPIMEAILVQLKETGDLQESKGEIQEKESPVLGMSNGESKGANVSVSVVHKDCEKDVGECTPEELRDGDAQKRSSAQYTLMCKGLSLSVCYAANCGGIASLTGTAPNLILKSNIDEYYEGLGMSSPVSFGTWFAFGFPLSAAVLILCFCWLNLAFLKCRCTGNGNSDQSQRVRKVIQDEYTGLGPMVFGQVMVLVLFIILVILWITRDMGGVAGWGSLFGVKVKDGTPAVLLACLVFAIPSTLPWLKSYENYVHPEDWKIVPSPTSHEQGKKDFHIRPLLNWKIVSEKFPWNLIFLLGGGFAISAASQESGLSQWVADELKFFNGWNKWGVLFIFCYVTASLTEVTSNTAIATILMPIMIQLANGTGVHPLYYMFPTAMACSFAFMLPVATPPNAIVFTYGRVSIPDMMKSGIMLNILAVPVLILFTGTIGDAIFDFQDVPTNSTLSTAFVAHI